jgi:hypothetical protein
MRLVFLFQFIFNLMACGKGSANQPIEDFITQAVGSSSPVHIVHFSLSWED